MLVGICCFAKRIYNCFMRFIQSILRGIGQVFFQNNIFSGILFLVGIFYNSWLLGLAALFGTVISTTTAQVLRFSKADIENGLYGFNGTLTGIAILYFFEFNFISVFALLLGSVFSTLVMHFLKKIIPPFTFPFVLTTWLIMSIFLLFLEIPLLSSSQSLTNIIDILSVSSNSFGQVMFQENIVTGVFFLLAILVNNRLMAVYAVYAVILGSLTGWALSEAVTSINSGFMGYNAILCAIALTGKSWKDLLWVSVAIVLSTLLKIWLTQMGIITLTAPFVLATWTVLILKNPKSIRRGINKRLYFRSSQNSEY